jgi:CRP/FNR family transcriptional regulator
MMSAPHVDRNRFGSNPSSAATLERPATTPTTDRLAEPCASCGARPSSICNAIGDRDLGRLAAVAVVSAAAAGQTFVSEGDAADDFFNVTSGTARLFKSLPDGRRQITGFAGRGHFLGLAVSHGYSFSAEAMEPVTYCRFSRRRLRLVFDDFPAFEKRLLDIAMNELVIAQEQMLLLGRKTARERVASFLIAWGEPGAPCVPRSPTLHLPMTRTDIADYLGLTIETVSRTLTRLKLDRLIGIPSNSEIIILDRARLAAQAAREE